MCEITLLVWDNLSLLTCIITFSCLIYTLTKKKKNKIFPARVTSSCFGYGIDFNKNVNFNFFIRKKYSVNLPFI